MAMDGVFFLQRTFTPPPSQPALIPLFPPGNRRLGAQRFLQLETRWNNPPSETVRTCTTTCPPLPWRRVKLPPARLSRSPLRLSTDLRPLRGVPRSASLSERSSAVVTGGGESLAVGRQNLDVSGRRPSRLEIWRILMRVSVASRFFVFSVKGGAYVLGFFAAVTFPLPFLPSDWRPPLTAGPLCLG